MKTFTALVCLVVVVAAEAYTELSPAQSSEIIHKLETLSATRPMVISVQSAVRAALPSDTFPDPSIGPFYQENLASLQQAETPTFTEAAWFPSLTPGLQSDYRELEAPGLTVERSIINEVVPITDGPAVAVATTMATKVRKD